LRTGDASTFLASDPANSSIRLGDHRGIREAVEDMMRKGWIKTKEDLRTANGRFRKE